MFISYMLTFFVDCKDVIWGTGWCALIDPDSLWQVTLPQTTRVTYISPGQRRLTSLQMNAQPSGLYY